MGYERFEELCKERGVTANIVSKSTGVATSTISNWKKGNYTPKRNKLESLAEYFGVSADEFEEPKKKIRVVFNKSSLFKGIDKSIDDKVNGIDTEYIVEKVMDEIDPRYKEAKEYLQDPALVSLILYAGSKLPEGNRGQFVDALCKTIDMLNELGEK